jgi:hypothetical protein
MVPLAGKVSWQCFTSFYFLQIVDVPPRLPERDFAGTPYVPVYVMLPVSYDFILIFHFLLSFVSLFLKMLVVSSYA